MTEISKVTVRVVTGDFDRAGTTGEVYLGLAGMEFKLNSVASVDYERGSDRTYVLGTDAGSHLSADAESSDEFAYAARNDPRITTVERAARHPVYVRLHPVGEAPDWLARAVHVTVVGQSGPTQEYRWASDPGRWLGCEYGLTVHLD